MTFLLYRNILRYMKIKVNSTDQAILQELGKRLAHLRIKQGITQAQASSLSGISKRTIERIENGGDSQLSTLIRLLKVLELIDNLEQLTPEISLSPMELLNLKGKHKRPQRASSKKTANPSKNWKWGDEQ